ncbi:MAG TPA: lysophospholipid acyltransferase family protein [Anaerolineaceae bacterium]|nr:lysophospholipid acyltransferase family protein [Anaerolineaceae bacterium]
MALPAQNVTYPRRVVLRRVLRFLIRLVFSVIADFKIEGRENLPKKGPLLVIINHFNFLDPVALIGILPWPIEFLGGTKLPNAPKYVWWLQRLYGVLHVNRGGVSRETLLASRSVLKQGGILGIAPEGGSWAAVLRPPRPGTSYLATTVAAPILPIGLDGLTEVFPLKFGRRARVTIRIGQPFGPFYVSERGETNRDRLEELGHEMMRQISVLIPPERRGHYSDDPAVRAAAQGTEIYPWADQTEV